MVMSTRTPGNQWAWRRAWACCWACLLADVDMAGACLMPESTNRPASPSSGLLSSLQGLLATLLAIFQTRLELLVTELEEEKLRLLKVLAWGAVALLLG